MSRSDLDKIQGQLRLAIQSHQMLVAKMKADPQNASLQKQLHDHQAEITSLSEKQKVIVQLLRKELVQKPASESTQATSLPKKQTESSSTNTSKHKLQVSNVHTSPSMTIKQKARHISKSHSRRKEMRPSSPLRVPSYPHHRPSLLQSHRPNIEYTHKTPDQSPVKRLPESDRTKENIKRTTFMKKELPMGEKEKCDFMAALDLVTPDTVKELQAKRTERKRRTTANPHFAYGGSESERKQAFSNYLASIGVKRPRGRPPKPSPSNSRPGTPDSNDSGVYRNGYARNGSIDGDVHDDFCAICRRSGQLLMCDTCSLVYHLHCLVPRLMGVPQGMWSCPKCHAEGKHVVNNPPSQVSQATLEMVNAYIANKAGKEDEKRRLLKRKSELQSESAQLESKSMHLKESIANQDKDKSHLVSMNNNTQASVDKIKKFIHAFNS